MNNAKDAKLYNSIKESEQKDIKAEITQSINFLSLWQTPGSYIASKIIDNHLVRFIGENFQTDYTQISIVIDEDLKELVDDIFSIEQEMYKKFSKLHLDLRLSGTKIVFIFFKT